MNQPDSAGVGCTCGFYGSVVHSSDCVPVVEEPSEPNCCPHGEQLRGPCIECPGEVAQIRPQDSGEFEKLLAHAMKTDRVLERLCGERHPQPQAVAQARDAFEAARAAVVSAYRRVEQWANVSDELNRANLEQAARIAELEAELKRVDPIADRLERVTQNALTLHDAIDKRDARIASLEAELAEAASEINCAGPVAHRIRVLKDTNADKVASLEATVATLKQGLSVAARMFQSLASPTHFSFTDDAAARRQYAETAREIFAGASSTGEAEIETLREEVLKQHSWRFFL